MLDPCALTTKSTSALNVLENLPMLMSVMSSDKEEKYQQEARQILVDFKLPSTDNWADKWCYSLEKKYPKLTKLALSLLSIFHGPCVKNSFIVMDDIMIDKKSNRMQVETYSAMQSVNYGLSSRATGNMKCVSVFWRENKVSSPVMPRLPFNINNACAAKRQTSVPDVTEKSTESQCVSEKSVEESNSWVISHDVEIENEDVILVANSSNDQGAHSNQTVELLEPPVKKKKQILTIKKKK